MRAYEEVYETIEDTEDSGDIRYIKLYNVGQKVVTKNCKGYLPSQVAFYLQASCALCELRFLGSIDASSDDREPSFSCLHTTLDVEPKD